MDRLDDVAAIIGASVALFSLIGVTVGWVVKTWLKTQLAGIHADVRAIKHEVMPNGGTSLADRVVRLETMARLYHPEPGEK